MIRETIQTDQIKALKSGDKDTLEVLRYILAQIKNKEIEKKANLSDEEVVSVLRKQLKELNESIEAFEKGGRNDLVGQCSKQKEVIVKYLPAEMSDEELQKKINAIIEKNKDLQQKNPKLIIGICMKELRQKADPSRIMKLLQQQ